MPWYFPVAERDHTIQNPTSVEKIRRVGEHLRLDANSRILDIACGRGGPALVFAQTFGCRIVGVEKAPEFAAVARQRVSAAGLNDAIEIVEADASAFPLGSEEFDAALCLGATFVWDGLARTLEQLAPVVRAGGHVVIGEPFWRRWPLSADIDDGGYTTLHGTAARFDEAGLSVVGLITASEDDWDTYESLHWRALEERLEENAGDPDAEEMGRLHHEFRDRYLSYQRELLGWAIIIGRKADSA
jgi:cyclopropane fatty-acyl-phospholipid synthase-like methyltransferase